MLVPSNETAALLTAFVSLACWGSWTNLLVGTQGKIRFELFYLDYSVATLVTALLGAFTLGMVQNDVRSKFGDEVGKIRFIPDDFSDVGADRYACALLAGLVFNAANIALCKGISMLGLALAFPLCIGTSMVLGVVLTYITSPKGVNAVLLFLGVFVAFCAVCLAAVMQHLKEQQQKPSSACQDGSLLQSGEGQNGTLQAGGEGGTPSFTAREVQAATAGLSEQSPTMARKLAVCIIGGILMGSWNGLATLAQKGPRGLSPFGYFVLFTLMVVLSSAVFIPFVIARPLEGGKGRAVLPILKEYSKAPLYCHFFAFGGGFVWAVGTLANAAASTTKRLSNAPAFAIGQCANVAAILWGIFLFKEFKGTDWKVKGLVLLVLLLYCGAIVLVALSTP